MFGLAVVLRRTALGPRNGEPRWPAMATALALMGVLVIALAPLAWQGDVLDFGVFGRDFGDGQRLGIRLLGALLGLGLGSLIAASLAASASESS